MSHTYNGLALSEAPNRRSRDPMLRTLSLSALFFLAIGLMFAAYAAVPIAS